MRVPLLVCVLCVAGAWGQVVQLRLAGACSAEFENSINVAETAFFVGSVFLSFFLSFLFLFSLF